MKTKNPAPDLIDHLRREWRTERPDLDTAAMDVVGRIILISEALHRSVGSTLEEFGLGYTDLDVLATLRRSGEPYRLRPADLLRTVLIQSGSLTACLDRLEKREWIQRVETPGDRRSRSVQLTAGGLELIDRAIEARFQDASRNLEALPRSDRRELGALLRRMLQGLQESEGAE
ncbi:hypothetical protein ABI59_13360 [Acidobacteria bacterium Mor1]|nr:hypothetical protein ABI59_13360 [Acidobacteria bacterium Mor1]